MRVVADTNVVVSGLLWHGPSRQLLNAARQGTVELFTSGVLLAELDEVSLVRVAEFIARIRQD
jgi:putative PIN family toxin of toxin-antitoxin system